jgi:hypothetical protein
MPPQQASDPIDRLLSLEPEQRRAIIGRLPPEQVKILTDQINARREKQARENPSETLSHILARKGTEYLPAIGATVGGTATGANPLGAAAGGMIGESAKELLETEFPSLGAPPETAIGQLEEIGTQGGLAAATEAIPFSTISAWLKRTAPLTYARIFGKVGEELGPQAERATAGLLKKGEIAPTRASLLKKATANVGRLGPQIGAKEAAAAGEEFATAPVLDSLDSLADRLNLYVKDSYRQGGKIAQEGRSAQIQALENIKKTITDSAQGGLISRESLRSVKQNAERLAKEVGGYIVSTEDQKLATQVRQQAADALRKVLDAPRPDIAKLDAEFSLWKSVRELIDPTKFKAERQLSPWEKRAIGGAAMGAIAEGTHLGHGPETAAAIGLIYAFDKAVNSTAWKTVSGVMKDRIADLLARGDTQAAIKLLSRVGVEEAKEPIRNAVKDRKQALERLGRSPQQ